MSKISAVLITFNEEADIARALRSVSWCDEVLVVDSGSSDRTREICETHGCRVLRRAFRGYGEQKAFAVSQAAHHWILAVDADEEVSPELRDEIRARLRDPGDCRGFYLRITTILWDHVLRNSDRHTKHKLRLFDRRFGNFRPQLVHESVAVEGRTCRLRERMYNYSFADIADYFDKFNRYTSAAAQDCHARGERSHFLGAIARVPLAFFQLYFLRGYFRDGSIGFTWSLFSALYPAVRQLKLRELCDTAPASPAALSAAASAWAAKQRADLCRCAAFAAAWRKGSSAARRRWAPAVRELPSAQVSAIVFATLSLAVFSLALHGHLAPGNYWLLFLTCVVAAARVTGFRAALVATGTGLVGLDYFVIPPLDRLSVPSPHYWAQLAVFAVLSLGMSFLVAYPRERRSFG